MKKLIYAIFITGSILCCSQKKELTLLDKVEICQISECKTNCNIDSVGVRRSEIKQGDLFVKFGYFLDCSWEEGYIENIIERNDTLIIHMNRPHDIDTIKTEIGGEITEEIVRSYEITSCDCFYFFDLKINNVKKAPKVIRAYSELDPTEYWDQSKINIPVIEEAEGVYDLNESPFSIKKLVLNNKSFYVTSGITDAKYLDDFCKFEDYHLQRSYNLVPKMHNNLRSDLKVYVKDDRNKMNRKYAKEVFQSIDINYKYLRAWSAFYVGMSIETLMDYISDEEFYSDKGIITVYSQQFKSEFFHENDVVTRIVIQRRCKD